MMHYWNYMTSSASQGYLLVLLDADQITLLSQGDRRGCKGQRAQAIMSAIGITSWYEEGLRVAQQVAMERYRVLKQTGANHTTPRLLSPDQSVLMGHPLLEAIRRSRPKTLQQRKRQFSLKSTKTSHWRPTEAQEQFHLSIEQDLVLGIYPMKFVEEICEKLPGQFFGTAVKGQQQW